MLDLRTARNALEHMAESHRENFNIGRVTRDFSSFSEYKKGEVVLFRDDNDGTVTVEMPYPQEEIDRQREQGSSIVSSGGMINVPKEYVEEIRV